MTFKFLIPILLISVAHAASINKKASADTDPQFGIVFDSGTSTTRMVIYTWDEKNDTLKQEYFFEKGPAITTIDEEGQADDYFEEFFENARDKIPKDAIEDTPIVLGATSSMRILNESDPDRAESILREIRSAFEKSGFWFKNESQVQIVPASDETVLSWIALNYQLGTFKLKTKPSMTYGIMDIGGASSAIGYISKDEDLTKEEDEYFGDVDIYDINYTPYAAGFTCYGVDQLLLIYQTYLISKANYSQELSGACFNKGSIQNVTTSALTQSNCANGLEFDYPSDIDIDALKEKPYYIINGESDPEKCDEEISKLLDDESCDFDDCSIDDAYLPEKENDHFYALSNYYYAINNTEILSDKSLKKDLEAYKTEATKLCSLDYDKLKELNDDEIVDKYLRRVCLNNNIILNMFEKNNITSLENVEVVLNYKGDSIFWGVGYLLNYFNPDDFDIKMSDDDEDK